MGPERNKDTNWYKSSGNNYEKASADDQFAKMNYDSRWITDAATAEMIDYTRNAGKYMANKNLTKSKIRSIYGEIKRIQMRGYEQEKSSFFLLKPKVAYALGRDNKNQGLKLFKLIFDRCSGDVTNQKSYENFCGFMEAILAYHKFYGGKD